MKDDRLMSKTLFCYYNANFLLDQVPSINRLRFFWDYSLSVVWMMRRFRVLSRGLGFKGVGNFSQISKFVDHLLNQLFLLSFDDEIAFCRRAFLNQKCFFLIDRFWLTKNRHQKGILVSQVMSPEKLLNVTRPLRSSGRLGRCEHKVFHFSQQRIAVRVDRNDVITSS